MLNTKIGKSIEPIVCDKCKEKVKQQMEKISKLDLLAPRKVMGRFAGLLCPRCLKKVIKKMQRGELLN